MLRRLLSRPSRTANLTRRKANPKYVERDTRAWRSMYPINDIDDTASSNWMEVRSMPTLDQIYRKFGETAEAAQLLETELGTIQLRFTAVERDLLAGDKGELATEIYRKINKSTLGQLLKQVANSAGISGEGFSR